VPEDFIHDFRDSVSLDEFRLQTPHELRNREVQYAVEFERAAGSPLVTLAAGYATCRGFGIRGTRSILGELRFETMAPWFVDISPIQPVWPAN
jgi:hypothetical protein